MAEKPMASFHFRVEWGGRRSEFCEVSGLTMEYDVIEYRDGSSVGAGDIKLPGRPRFTNIVLKRGIIRGDNDFYEWMKSVSIDRVERRSLAISLLNEQHEPVMTWKVRNAFPVRLEGPSLVASSSEVAIETLELAHEGFEIENEG